MRILIVEDNQKLAKYIKQILEESGYAVDVVHDGETGERMADSNEYDLVILDIRMPDVDGMEVLRQIRENNIPGKVVMLTAVGELKYAQDSLDLGASDFMTKPVDLNDLLTCINRTLAS